MFLLTNDKSIFLICNISESFLFPALFLLHPNTHLDGLSFNLKHIFQSFAGGSVVKDPPSNVGDWDLVFGWRIFPGEGNGIPFLYSCLENSLDRGVWWATAHALQRVRHD